MAAATRGEKLRANGADEVSIKTGANLAARDLVACDRSAVRLR